MITFTLTTEYRVVKVINSEKIRITDLSIGYAIYLLNHDNLDTLYGENVDSYKKLILMFKLIIN